MDRNFCPHRLPWLILTGWVVAASACTTEEGDAVVSNVGGAGAHKHTDDAGSSADPPIAEENGGIGGSRQGGSGGTPEGGTGGTGETGERGGTGGTAHQAGTGAQAGAGGASGSDQEPTQPVQPKFVDLKLRCKLISNRNIDDPTPNNTHYRANLRGTDLGISVEHGNDLYFFFGDTAGSQHIWPLGPESLPDAVGYSDVPYSSVAKDPNLLCSNLRFLLTGGKTGSVAGDFAGGSMQPPAGRDISEFIHNPAGPRGANMFPHLPGDFEVPSGAFSYGGSIYVFYTTVNLDPFEMQGAYLAKWKNPSTTGKPNYQILYQVDQRFDSNGQMQGNFINIAALVEPPYLYLYGTGKYRLSPVHLARKLLSDLDSPSGFEVYNPTTKTWGNPKSITTPIVIMPAIGELSVQYFPDIKRYVMMDGEPLGIIARFAEKPEGPWSSGVTVASMADPAFALKHCCINLDCPGDRLLNCDRAGFYGTYMLPDLIVHDDDSFTISFTMSTWDPYNVALMAARFK